ncbi:MAG: hypothetical protein JW739_01425, partial [Opitutales bacterium]|nr:hypothetical protein [Opitutales bacterium]
FVVRRDSGFNHEGHREHEGKWKIVSHEGSKHQRREKVFPAVVVEFERIPQVGEWFCLEPRINTNGH